METQYSYYHVLFVHFRSYPTYEEWKHSSSDLFSPMSSSSSYPTYEEWKLLFCLDIVFLYFVLILPMRNGNALKMEKKRKLLERSYPTYEEWKLKISVISSIFFSGSYPTYEEWKLFVTGMTGTGKSVLILPMRNGNRYRKVIAGIHWDMFLSYL